MDTCCICGKKYKSDDARLECDCGGGLIASDDETFLDWLDEQGNDDF